MYLVITVILSSFSLYLAYAAPQGASISGVSVDSGPTIVPGSRNDSGGQIISLTLSADQQNDAWKAYVGNVTGTYVLQNSNNYSIYEWPLGSSIEGEVYISRSSGVNWTSGVLVCANLSTMTTEQAVFGAPICKICRALILAFFHFDTKLHSKMSRESRVREIPVSKMAQVNSKIKIWGFDR